MYLRDKIFKKANKSPTSSNNKYSYRKFRNSVVAEQRQSKIKYFQNYFEKYKINMKTPNEIEIIINSLNKNKSTGPYSIPVVLLKILRSYIACPLATIVNHSFEYGILPNKLKLGKINPLNKKYSTDYPSNYRPISILSVFSKIIEKLMHKRLYNFFDTFQMLYHLQFGFHEKHSTIHALLSLTKAIKVSIDNGKFGCGILSDLQRLLTQSITRSYWTN